MLLSHLFEQKHLPEADIASVNWHTDMSEDSSSAFQQGYERGLKNYRRGPSNPYPPGTEAFADYNDGYQNGEADSHEKYDTSSMNEAPGAETLAHNQSTVAGNMNAFDLEEGDISQLEKDIAAAPVEPIANMEAEEKIGGMDADAFDAAIARLKQIAGSGPLKTVWDPKKRVYRNMPTAVQPAQQPKK